MGVAKVLFSEDKAVSGFASDLVLDIKFLGRDCGSERDYDLLFPAPEGFSLPLIGVAAGSEVSLSLNLRVVSEGVLASGVVEACVRGECGRCLEIFEYPLQLRLHEFFIYAGNTSFGEDENNVREIQNSCIDFKPVLRDAIIGSLPFQPVCEKTCLGLCVQCGFLLKQDSQHSHEVFDPRWKALSGLNEENLLNKREES